MARSDMVYTMRDTDVGFQLWTRVIPGGYDVQLVLLNRHEGYVKVHGEEIFRSTMVCKGGDA